MPSPAGQPPVVRFGAFELDASDGELRKDGISLKLHPQPFRVLVLLTERPGEIVTREEIQHCLWGNHTFVDFDRGINFCIRQIRAVLADDAANPRYIETVPRRGYRFKAGNGLFLTPKSSCFTTHAPVLTPEPAAKPGSAEAAPGSHLLSKSEIWVAPQLIESTKEQWPRRIPLALVASVLVAAVVIATTLAVFHFRQSPKLTEKDTVLLADFDNKTGDPVFDETLKQGFAVQLSQSPYLNILSDSTVRDTLKLMGRSPDERHTPEVVREACRRTGNKAYFAGSIAKLNSQYVIGLNLMNCETDSVLVREQVTANGKEHVLQALGTAATRLRRKVGESLASVQRFDVPIEQATTPSLEALQAYSLGRGMLNTDPSAAVSFFEQAIRLDPNFTMAYASQGNAYAKLGESRLSVESLTKAFELRDHTSEREKFYIDSHYYATVGGNWKRAAEIYELWARTYPRDSLPVGNLGAIYGGLGDVGKRLSVNLKGMQLDPTEVGAYYGAAGAYLSLGRFAEARAVAREAYARGLDSYGVRLVLYQLGFLAGDRAEMAEQVNWSAGKAGIEDMFLSLEALSAAYHGRLHEAQALWERAAGLAKRNGQIETAAQHAIDLAAQEADFGKFATARHRVADALTLPIGPDTQSAALAALARAGDTHEAEKIADELAKKYPQDTGINGIYLPTIRGAIELNRRNPKKAVELLSEISPYELGSADQLYSAYLLGLAYLQLGENREASAEFQKILDHPGVVRNSPIGALAHLQLGRALTRKGERAKARGEYDLFLALWKDADPDLPILKEAKTDYAKLP